MISYSPAWLNESHPNFEKWKRGRELSLERGKLVQLILSRSIELKNLYFLDLGSGEGGTSKVLSENNFVVSLDLSLVRLKRQNLNVISKRFTQKNSEFILRHLDPDLSEEKSDPAIIEDNSACLSGRRVEDSFEMTSINSSNNFPKVNASALQLPFANNSFDLIIIQDVIEHLDNHLTFYNEINRVLKPNGIIYLSTPNRFSILNIFSDPHFGLPFVSVLTRKSIRKYFLKYFRKDDYNRTDIAQLLSLKELIKLFGNDFNIQLNTKFVTEELFKGNKGIVWSDFHLKLISYCKLIRLDWALIKIANDNIGVINNYFTPTFYTILNRLT